MNTLNKSIFLLLLLTYSLIISSWKERHRPSRITLPPERSLALEKELQKRLDSERSDRFLRQEDVIKTQNQRPSFF